MSNITPNVEISKSPEEGGYYDGSSEPSSSSPLEKKKNKPNCDNLSKHPLPRGEMKNKIVKDVLGLNKDNKKNEEGDEAKEALNKEK
ncbi:unnamed protein product [Amaranthus hypochondriacus]